MDTRTLEALRASIAKWERNVATAQRALDEGRTVIATTARALFPDTDAVMDALTIFTTAGECALCMLFLIPEHVDCDTMCVGCPVMDRTGETCCRNTPYGIVCDIIDTNDPIPATQAIVDACQAEVDFLRSLLPADEVAA